MATNHMFSDGSGNQQDSQGWDLPPSGPPHRRLTEREYWDCDWGHMLFRAFHPSEDADPLQSVHTMNELLHRWMRPDVRTKKQIMDQLLLEKFMTCMPLELQVLVKERRVQRERKVSVMTENH